MRMTQESCSASHSRILPTKEFFVSYPIAYLVTPVFLFKCRRSNSALKSRQFNKWCVVLWLRKWVSFTLKQPNKNFFCNKTSFLLLILEYSVMTSNGLAVTSNHMRFHTTTYAKGKNAYVFQGQQNIFQIGGAKEHWKVLPATMVDQQETFLNSRCSRMAKKVTF